QNKEIKTLVLALALATALKQPTSRKTRVTATHLRRQRKRQNRIVLIAQSSTLGGPSFSSAIQFVLDSWLQPLKFQGLNPLIRRSFSSGLKSRPPYRMAGSQLFSNWDYAAKGAAAPPFSTVFDWSW